MTWSTPVFASVAALLTERSGLSFPPTRRAFAEAGIARAMAQARVKDSSLYLERLTGDLEAFETLIGEITVGETYFYRDPKQFEFIKEHVLPKFGPAPRIWSAGCSTGEEPYSIAIALEQCGGESRAQILGSDISSAAILTARAGVYGDWSFREIDSMWRARYFERSTKNRWKIAPRFASRVSFETRNLAGMPAIDGGFDLIFCRNVLMYLESDVVARVTSMFINSLREGGWLFTSPSDPIVSDDSVEIVTTPAGLAYRKQAARPSFALSRSERSDAHERAPDSGTVHVPSLRTTNAQRYRAQPGRTSAVSAVVQIVDEALDPRRYVREAMQFLDENRAGEAAIAARRAIFLDRAGALAHLLLGRALRLGGRAVAARRALGRARRLSEDGDGIAASVEAELSLLRTRSSEIGVGV